jgi:hypothetical protein
MCRKLCFLICSVITVCLIISDFAAASVLSNGGFENGNWTSELNTPTDWWKWGDSIGWASWKNNSSEAHSGSKFVRLGGNDSSQFADFGEDVLGIKAGAVYVFDAWVKTENWGSPTAILKVEFKNKDNWPIRTNKRTLFTGQKSIWQKYTLKTAPAPAGTVRANFICEGIGKGSVYFDDIYAIPSLVTDGSDLSNQDVENVSKMKFTNLFSDCKDKKVTNGLVWLNEPNVWSFDANENLAVKPKGGTDFFRCYNTSGTDNAGLLYVKAAGNFTVVTRVKLKSIRFADAGGITIRRDKDLWAKLCLERSPIGDISIVSVITRQWSDDSNGELLKNPDCWLRVTRDGNIFGMHYSLDGKVWRFVRYFALPDMPEEIIVGIHAQAAFAEGCSCEFTCFELSHEAVKDFRSGE